MSFAHSSQFKQVCKYQVKDFDLPANLDPERAQHMLSVFSKMPLSQLPSKLAIARSKENNCYREYQEFAITSILNYESSKK